MRLKEEFIAHGCHLLIIQGFHVRARADVDRLVLLRWLIGSEIQDG